MKARILLTLFCIFAFNAVAFATVRSYSTELIDTDAWLCEEEKFQQDMPALSEKLCLQGRHIRAAIFHQKDFFPSGIPAGRVKIYQVGPETLENPAGRHVGMSAALPLRYESERYYGYVVLSQKPEIMFGGGSEPGIHLIVKH